MDCCLLKAIDNCLHKYYFCHQNSTSHFSKIPHPVAEILLMLFGWTRTKCHLQLETSRCWIALTFFPPFAAQASKDSCWRKSVARGTGRAREFLIYAHLLAQQLGHLSEHDRANLTHLEAKGVCDGWGTTFHHCCPWLLPVSWGWHLPSLRYYCSPAVGWWWSFPTLKGYCKKHSHFQENVSLCKLVDKLLLNINII